MHEFEGQGMAPARQQIVRHHPGERLLPPSGGRPRHEMGLIAAGRNRKAVGGRHRHIECPDALGAERFRRFENGGQGGAAGIGALALRHRIRQRQGPHRLDDGNTQPVESGDIRQPADAEVANRRQHALKGRGRQRTHPPVPLGGRAGIRGSPRGLNRHGRERLESSPADPASVCRAALSAASRYLSSNSGDRPELRRVS